MFMVTIIAAHVDKVTAVHDWHDIYKKSRHAANMKAGRVVQAEGCVCKEHEIQSVGKVKQVSAMMKRL
jgi:hypothetical protein